MTYQIVIGLEVHVQLNTVTKLFSSSLNKFGSEANTNLSYLDQALPGTLPIINREAIAKAITFGLATKAQINTDCYFERKNYFYPDLPKGYQISQNAKPINAGGVVDIDSARSVRLNRAHLEEDAGKSIHGGEGIIGSGIDLNRSGVPLLEVVTEPDIRSASEAIAFLKTLHTMVKDLGISNAQMQEGNFRCDVNISLRSSEADEYGTRVELKNLNSFKFIEQAIDYEYNRQSDMLDSGQSILQETRLYDADANETRAMRSKEATNDYRHFPDPDLPPLQISQEWIEKLRRVLPMSEGDKRHILREKAVAPADIPFFSGSTKNFNYFIEVCTALNSSDVKAIVNFIRGDISKHMNQKQCDIDALTLTPSMLAHIISMLGSMKITKKQARDCINQILEDNSDPQDILDGLDDIAHSEKNDGQAMRAHLTELLQKHQDQAEQLRNGKTKVSGFFIGKVMQQSQGEDPAQVAKTLAELVNELKQ